MHCPRCNALAPLSILHKAALSYVRTGEVGELRT
jgi:hypothetical protein